MTGAPALASLLASLLLSHAHAQMDMGCVAKHCATQTAGCMMNVILPDLNPPSAPPLYSWWCLVIPTFSPTGLVVTVRVRPGAGLLGKLWDAGQGHIHREGPLPELHAQVLLLV